MLLKIPTTSRCWFFLRALEAQRQLRFNGVLNAVNGDFLAGTGDVECLTR